MSSTNIKFPGNIGQVDTIGDLRDVAIYALSRGELFVVTGAGRFYTWEPSDTSVDDGVNVIRPSDLTPLQAGRWLLEATGFAPGPPGPANSTYTSLAALKAASPANITYALVTATGDAEFVYREGNYTGRANDIDVVALSGTPLTTGALVRVGFERVSVRAFPFGARGDGVTDDRPAIQAAIDYVFARGGGTVFIPRGTYNFSSTAVSGYFGLVGIIQRPGVFIEGEGKGVTVLRWNDDDALAGPGAAIRLICSPSGVAEGLEIRHLTVDGNYQNQPKLAGETGNGGNIVYGLFDAGVPGDVVIEHVESRNAYGQGIQVVGLDYASNVRAFNVRIQHNDVHHCSFIGIQVSQFVGLWITGNNVSFCEDNGIDWYGFNNNFSSPAVTSSRFTVTDNFIANCGGAGLFPETIRDGIIAGNKMEGCINGIQANCIGGTMDGVFIYGNQSTNCQNGYAHTGAHATTWDNNMATGFTFGGFVLGTVGGEASYARYSNFRFKPSSKSVPLVVIPVGVIAANFNDPGARNYIEQADTTDPTLPAGWFFNPGGALIVGTRRPIFASATEATASDRLYSPVIEGRPLHIEALQVFANNAAAVAALGTGIDYLQAIGGPIYRTY